ncbi:hypothetical protein [Ammoniphilus sp. 3BR4]|uniref:hypothetical protein n=1 Tax=Ammoniphilus sp. 3BR4 TaxID=3158265 RepID=UPI003467E56C
MAMVMEMEMANGTCAVIVTITVGGVVDVEDTTAVVTKLIGVSALTINGVKTMTITTTTTNKYELLLLTSR